MDKYPILTAMLTVGARAFLSVPGDIAGKVAATRAELEEGGVVEYLSMVTVHRRDDIERFIVGVDIALRMVESTPVTMMELSHAELVEYSRNDAILIVDEGSMLKEAHRTHLREVVRIEREEDFYLDARPYHKTTPDKWERREWMREARKVRGRKAMLR